MADGRSSFVLQLRIGAFVLAGLGIFLAIIYLLGAEARYFERKMDLVADFAEVGGLTQGATVRLAGVQIGRVTSVELPPVPGGKVRVTMTIARRFADRIRRDSEAQILTQGLLGDKLIEISIGSAAAPPVGPGDRLQAREAFEMQQAIAAGTATLERINQLAASLQGAAERVQGTLERVNRFADEVQGGRGLLHALIYEEPEALRRLNALLDSTQRLLARAEGGEGAVGVLLSRDGGKAARGLLTAMETIARLADRAERGDGLLQALLFDPEYRGVAQDLRTVARNFREVSERLARGEGLLGELLVEEPGSEFGQAAADFRAAMANLRAVTDRLRAGEGTLGALLEDPTVYENLVKFLEGARRSFLLRSLMRSTLEAGAGAGERRK